jgi:hypothetical protein
VGWTEGGGPGIVGLGGGKGKSPALQKARGGVGGIRFLSLHH